jgi:hypothetical protein
LVALVAAAAPGQGVVLLLGAEQGGPEDRLVLPDLRNATATVDIRQRDPY